VHTVQKWFLLLVVGLLLAGGSAGATPVTLSSLSSDATPAASLGATYDFVVTGSTLRLTVTNQSQYDIVAIFFNDSNDVADITLTGVEGSSDGWLFRSTGDFMSTPSFGTFDHALHSPVWRNQNLEGVGVGDIVTFIFDIDCAGSLVCDASDFANQTSFNGPVAVNAAGRFIRGPEGSTNPFGGGTKVGGQIPEPATALLLAAGLVAISARLRLAARRGA
jgi:hypothetical protein